jgi:outer membrane protein assembly factor BamE (lipoprotein component of BamABCDE complex)
LGVSLLPLEADAVTILGDREMMRLPFATRKSIDGRTAQSRCRGAVQQGKALGVVAAIGLALAACAETVTKHGHQFQENDLKQISTGMSQEQVRTALGTPTTTATVGSGTAYYYISSTQGQTSFFKPVEKDRKVLAVYFSQLGSVDRVAHYGLKDGKVFDFARQKTPTPSRDEGLLKALFRNLGQKQFGGD